MKITENLLDYLLSLDKDDFKKYLLIFAGGLLILLSTTAYIINMQSSHLYKKIQTLNLLTKKSSITSASYRKIQEKKRFILDTLEDNKNFDIKSFFENYCKETNIKPEPNWTTISSPISRNDMLMEVSLQALFKNLKMRTIVEMLDSLEKKDNIYIKSIKILQEPNISGAVTLELTIGSFAYKQK